MFFERTPDRAVAGTIDNAEFYDLVLQQPQGPACASLGRLGTGQGNQLGLLLAVKNPSNGRHRARLAAQHGLEALFHQLFAHPVNHGWAGFQSFDDPVVAPPFASFRDIGLQQDPRLPGSLRGGAARAPEGQAGRLVVGRDPAATYDLNHVPYAALDQEATVRGVDRLCVAGRRVHALPEAEGCLIKEKWVAVQTIFLAGDIWSVMEPQGLVRISLATAMAAGSNASSDDAPRSRR